MQGYLTPASPGTVRIVGGCVCVCVCAEAEVSLPPVADSQVLRKDTVMGLPIFDSTSDVLGIH